MSVTHLVPSATLTPAERAVRADCLLILVRAKLMLLGSAETAMAALGISRDDMAEARDRSTGRMTTSPAAEPWRLAPPPDRSAAADVAYRETAPRRTAPVRHPAPTRTRRADDDGNLRCTRCGEWQPAANFRLRTDRIGTGSRRSACDPCHAKANRLRYVSLAAKDALNVVGIVLSLEPGDDAARLRCARCKRPLGTDDDVTTGSVVLAHVRCPE